MAFYANEMKMRAFYANEVKMCAFYANEMKMRAFSGKCTHFQRKTLPSRITFIALLSMLITFLLYWIFVLLIKPLMRKSNACQYLFPCSR